MTNKGDPTHRGQLHGPASVACCRWTLIDFAAIASGQAVTAPDPGQDRANASEPEPAGADTVLLGAP